MTVTVIQEDGLLAAELNSPALVVVDFFATWSVTYACAISSLTLTYLNRCGPCQRIAPVFETLSSKYSTQARFLKVDVDRCPQTAAQMNVSSMPVSARTGASAQPNPPIQTFMFFRNKQRVGMVSGADAQALEGKIVELIGSGDATAASDCPVAGHMDLAGFVVKSDMECLNESDEHTLKDALTPGKEAFLESDCDEQLIISVGFSQNVKLHSLVVSGPPEQGAKTLKIFTNQPKTLDFDKADSMEPVQELQLTPAQLTSGEPVQLRFVKFQNVSNLQLFVKDNQSGAETTIVHHLAFIGSPVSTTNMNDFKRVGGKKGETHF